MYLIGPLSSVSKPIYVMLFVNTTYYSIYIFDGKMNTFDKNSKKITLFTREMSRSGL